MGKQKYTCPICSSIFERYASTVKVEAPFCSRSCSAKSLVGAKNPNFGNKWSECQRLNFSKTKIEDFKNNPELRYSAGSANRGKTFSPERIASMHSNRMPESYARPVSVARKQLISIQSSENWKDLEFRKRVVDKGRKTKEQKGLITPQHLMPIWKIYWNAANWKSKFNYGTIEHGFCRDHIVGRRQGFENGIFPEILKHPENCQFLTISENSKKARKAANPIEIENLFNRIKNYNGNYPDHHHVIVLLNRYINGERWRKE